MNFVFISPAFPENYYNFCNSLKINNVNVLGIGDTPYEQLTNNVKNSLTEYYKVNSLENYDEVYKAVAFFAFKYGRIDYLESNNEYWLRQDAKLRLDFNIKGAKPDDVSCFTSKSKMKEFYKLAKVPVARYKFCTDINSDLKFIDEVGYPVVVKPDVGVGASKTYRISSPKDLETFYKNGFNVPYIIEEYIEGNIVSLDGVCNSQGNIVFCDNEIFPPSIMDIVNENLEVSYYVNKIVPNDIKDIGQRVLKAFNIRQRFFHLEFFRLTKEKKGLGKINDIVALEVNMRPPGGYTPDLINFGQSVNCYQIWADVMCFDKTFVDLNKEKFYAVYVSKRDRLKYKNSYETILEKYKNNITMHGRMTNALADALGNEYYMAKFSTLEEINSFKSFVLEKKDN